MHTIDDPWTLAGTAAARLVRLHEDRLQAAWQGDREGLHEWAREPERVTELHDALSEAFVEHALEGIEVLGTMLAERSHEDARNAMSTALGQQGPGENQVREVVRNAVDSIPNTRWSLEELFERALIEAFHFPNLVSLASLLVEIYAQDWLAPDARAPLELARQTLVLYRWKQLQTQAWQIGHAAQAAAALDEGQTLETLAREAEQAATRTAKLCADLLRALDAAGVRGVKIKT